MALGGRRRDLNKERIGGRLAALPKDAPTPKQTAARQKTMETRAKAERKAAKVGREGAKAYRIKVRDLQGQHARTLTQTIRCRPGTFEWRYGRDKQNALFYGVLSRAVVGESGNDRGKLRGLFEEDTIRVHYRNCGGAGRGDRQAGRFPG
jgi:hypothetical protein